MTSPPPSPPPFPPPCPPDALLKGPDFGPDFQTALYDLFRWRRDVRRFRRDPLPDALLAELFEAAMLAPSVGLSEPWRYVQVQDSARREAVRQNFRACNREALSDYAGARAKLYASLKLSGLEEAPVQLAVYCQPDPQQGHGLGRKTMPETLNYSVVASIQNFWLAARAKGVGVGWVSILDPKGISQSLEIPVDWTLIAYLCVGFPQEEHLDPELERHRWESRANFEDKVLTR